METKRVVSIDLFRGLVIAAMIIVNNPGSWRSIYAPLRHAEWHGWTATDLIFPFFLFIVGISIKMSIDKQVASGKNISGIGWKVCRRSFLLFFLGLFLSGFPAFNLNIIRIPGVLQRIACCYFLAAFLYLLLVGNQAERFPLRKLLSLTLLLLVIYYLLMRFVPVPGTGAAMWDSKDGNLAAYIDRTLFGSHLWRQSKTWDPEGLLSTIPALATTLSGIIAAGWLVSRDALRNRWFKMALSGVILTGLAQITALFFPINKNLWTSSYVILTTGMALIVLSLCVWYADVRGYRRGIRPFMILGSNAISVYFLSSLLAVLLARWSINGYIFASLLDPLLPSKFASLIYALLYLLFWLAPMAFLYRKRIFIKI